MRIIKLTISLNNTYDYRKFAYYNYLLLRMKYKKIFFYYSKYEIKSKKKDRGIISEEIHSWMQS